jgi:hypothetical protein
MVMPHRLVAPTAFLVRPYDARIRARVQRLLESLGYAIDPQRTILAGTPDGEAAALLLRYAASTLVVPFHAHKDSEGRQVDGLGLLQLLAAERPDFPWRVLMPVSRVAAAAAMLRARSTLPPEAHEGVLVVYEDQLDSLTTSQRARIHLEASPMKPFALGARRSLQ